jgi:hypothetical protein
MTLNLASPENATVLFDGKSLDGWQTRDGNAPGWTIKDGIATVKPGTGDIMSKALFRDQYLHLEFCLPDMPKETGQAKANSGVFLQGRYEVQVLDSFGWAVPGMGDCAGIYDIHAPLVNASKPALEWQTYDIAFRASRYEGGEKVEDAKITVFFNGVVVQNNSTLPRLTGAPIDENDTEPGPLLLQDHGDLVSYRNVWIVELPETSSDEYSPQ